MSSPSGPQQPFPNDPQQQFPPAPGSQDSSRRPATAQPGGFPPGWRLPAPARRRSRPVAVAAGRSGSIASWSVSSSCWPASPGSSMYLNRDAANKAKVGDCVAQEGSDDLKVVECGSADADYKVVGRVEDKTQTEAGISACGPFVDQGAEQAYWEGESGKKGLVLCLAPAK